MPPKEADFFFNSLGDKFVYCNVEWLVKWKDLGYEHATWELESSSFLCTPEAEELKRS
jgi:chromodomain-helicase-DNA-binding protein 3